MRRELITIVVVGSLCAMSFASSVFSATVHKVDDTTVSGELMSIADGKITIGVKSSGATTQSTTRQTTQATTTTVSTTQPTTAPTAIAVSDVVQVVLREPPPKKPPPPAPREPNEPQNAEPSGFFTWAINTIFSTSQGKPPADELADTPAKQRPNAAATQTGATTAPASQPTVVSPWKIKLSDGDTLHGAVEKWSEKQMTLKLDAAGGQKVELPADQLTEVWYGSDELQKKARELAIEPGPEDVAFVQKENDVVSVKGLAMGIDGESLRFKFGDEERKIATSKLVGVVVGIGQAKKPVESFHQSLKLDSGDVISGAWIGVDQETIALRTVGGSEIHVPLRSIYTIDFLGGRLVYLSDLKPVKVEQTPYFGRVMPFRLDQSLDGGPLQMSDGIYSKGIAVHSRCVLEYDIGGAFQRFRTKLGFELDEGKRGRVAVRVLADGKVLFENADARGDDRPIEIDADVNGVHRLSLEVDFGKDQDVGDRVIWANAQLVRAKPAE